MSDDDTAALALLKELIALRPHRYGHLQEWYALWARAEELVKASQQEKQS